MSTMKNVRSNYGNTLLRTQFERNEHSKHKRTMNAHKKAQVMRILKSIRGRKDYAQIVPVIARDMSASMAEFAEIIRMGRSV